MNGIPSLANRRGLSLTVAIALHAAALLWMAALPSPSRPHGEAPPEHTIFAQLLERPAPVVAQPERTPEPAPPTPLQVSKPVSVTPRPQVKAEPLMTAVAPTTPTMPAAATNAPAPEPARDSAAAQSESTTRTTGAPAAMAATSLPARPDYAYNPKPDYPDVARRFGLTGQVLMRVLVETDGAPSDIRIADSSGHDILDQAALRSVRRWRFLPAKQAGQAYASWVEFKVRFDLN